MINLFVKPLNIDAIIYNSNRNEFNNVRDKILSLELFNLN
jgi:hypothetical protein